MNNDFKELEKDKELMDYYYQLYLKYKKKVSEKVIFLSKK